MSIVAVASRDLISVEGPDAVTYLQGQLSQDVSRLGEGDVAWTFVLAPQGKVEGWGRIHRAAADRFEIVVDEGAGVALEARLLRFLLRTKAEISLTEGVRVMAVRGPLTDDVLGCMDPGSTSPVRWLSSGWPVPAERAAGESGSGSDGFDGLLADGVSVEAEVDRLVSAGATSVGTAVLEAVRIRAGVPSWESELSADTIPATVGQWVIDASVSFTKGCFTGQELVARIDSRGGNVPRLLHGLMVDAPAPAGGTPVLLAEDPSVVVGEVTSSAGEGDGDGGPSVAMVFVPRSIEVGQDPIPVTVGSASARLCGFPLPIRP